MVANGMCHLCGEREATCIDHRWEGGRDDGPVRGMLCNGCNVGLGVVERVGLLAVVGYLGASQVGVDIRDVVNARHRAWRARNQERVREYEKSYYERHKEKLKARARAYYAAKKAAA